MNMMIAPECRECTMHILTLTLGGNDFGILLEDVEHIEERVDNIVKLPTTPEYIKGLVTVHGVVMPVYSLAVLFLQKQLILLIDLKQLMMKKERDEISQIMAKHMRKYAAMWNAEQKLSAS